MNDYNLPTSPSSPLPSPLSLWTPHPLSYLILCISYAQFEHRNRLARMTYEISLFTEGMPNPIFIIYLHLYMLFAIYYLLSIIYYLLSIIYYLLFIIYYLLFIIYYLLFIIYYLLFIIYYLLFIIYYLLFSFNSFDIINSNIRYTGYGDYTGWY